MTKYQVEMASMLKQILKQKQTAKDSQAKYNELKKMHVEKVDEIEKLKMEANLKNDESKKALVVKENQIEIIKKESEEMKLKLKKEHDENLQSQQQIRDNELKFIADEKMHMKKKK